MRARPLSSINPTHLAKPFHDQFSPAEDRQQELEERLDEQRDDWLYEIEPPEDPQT
jgi:hypothetical protein